MADYIPDRLAVQGEVLLPEKENYWNPKGVPLYKKPVVRVVCSIPIAATLFGWFLSVRGYQSVITSRIILYSAAAFLMFAGYSVASSLSRLRRVCQLLLAFLILAGSIVIDMKTVPLKTVSGTVKTADQVQPPPPAQLSLAPKQEETTEKLAGTKKPFT